jgi:hypothetical protein
VDKNLMSLINQAVTASACAMCAEADMLTLGELVARLDALPSEMPIVLEDGQTPGRFMSYRGYYDMISFNRQIEPKTVGQFRLQVSAAIGSTHEGYKGGDFKMTRHTPVWLSEYSQCEGLGVIGLEVADGRAIIKTAKVDS